MSEAQALYPGHLNWSMKMKQLPGLHYQPADYAKFESQLAELRTAAAMMKAHFAPDNASFTIEDYMQASLEETGLAWTDLFRKLTELFGSSTIYSELSAMPGDPSPLEWVLKKVEIMHAAWQSQQPGSTKQ